MPFLSVKVRSNTSVLQRLIKGLPNDTETMLVDKAEGIVEYVQAHWSNNSPSAPGKPPAVVTGELDASIAIDKQSQGRKIRVAIVIRAEHGFFLEFGTKKMAARPFVRPAMKRAERDFRSWWKGLFK